MNTGDPKVSPLRVCNRRPSGSSRHRGRRTPTHILSNDPATRSNWFHVHLSVISAFSKRLHRHRPIATVRPGVADAG